MNCFYFVVLDNIVQSTEEAIENLHITFHRSLECCAKYCPYVTCLRFMYRTFALLHVCIN